MRDAAHWRVETVLVYLEFRIPWELILTGK